MASASSRRATDGRIRPELTRMRASTPRYFDGGKSLEQRLASRRHAWLQIVGGEVEVNGTKLAKDAAVSEESANQRSLLTTKLSFCSST